MDPLVTPIEYLKGVGPQRAELLRSELNVHTYIDLLQHFPFRYVDRSKFHRVAELHEEMPQAQLRGVLGPLRTMGEKQGRRLTATFSDPSGSVELVWFKGVRWLHTSLKPGQEYILFGKPNVFKGRFNFPHPELELAATWEKGLEAALQPVYRTTEKLTAKGLGSRAIWKLQKTALEQVAGHVPETLSSELVEWLGGVTRDMAFRQIHAPQDQARSDAAIHRLKFEELFFLQLRLLKQKLLLQHQLRGNVFTSVGQHFNSFYTEHLPFELTGAQKRVVKEIRKDMGSGHQMNRLLQGDVGSGKTLVGLLSMLIALDNGFQSALMAPTEILAQQHYATLARFLEGLPVEVRLLTGSTKAAERKSILAALKAGAIHFIVGTHALLEDRVVFQRLGLVVIDEQHRFGVAQRARLWAKSAVPPHVLVMTATPIPRTLAMTLYGDLDTSVIDELPPGRKPIRTVHRYDSSRNAVFGFMEEEITQGRQIYVVYPLIEEADPEKMNGQELKDLTDGFESITRRFPLPKYAVSMLHGRMDQATKDYEMARFKKGETNVLVATTVIEVGVDVPNASVMVIENAERFGLSQLHQLRGRVGRGGEQSFCILMTGEKLGNDARTRIETMVRTNDGFEIAETDLRLRGPGDLMGTLQSGLPELHIADLIADAGLLQQARQVAIRLLDLDPELRDPKHAAIATSLAERSKGKPLWGRIS
ncbi:MAG: ATP-dependent DNA helicase RecG [Flavobacteriales bacterium]|jgi:ATP-dependent DNA helicase RecG|nr:ATP-dependent DNA helicase RecG [Flavobacteriales bacterium]MBK6883566.1 ATP-dependent DNA helicase RecG [Flavobacteriales bacterium]MBK7113002.1 ATP-dependent DNA helicase RecG [Flavobacteriales bacterium]MBK7619236.1 ATP-dependent DNA helicase RecG [Flavobacteriales bacterium]MBK8533320.1 ATP-dependent DNA helicase RecG [Flavobacteriales bacterium]